MSDYPFFTRLLKRTFCDDMELGPDFESKLLFLDDLVTIRNMDLIIRCVENCCSTINPDYLAASINKLRSKVSRTRTKRNYKFDIAIIFGHTLEQLRVMTDEDIIRSTEAILIVEKGECHKLPEAFSINLICSNSGKGKFLISLFIYCIINNSNVLDKRGVLELANSYLNIAGLCLYSKYGFEYDPNMYGPDCFEDVNNLPMIVDTNNYYVGPNRRPANQIIAEKNNTLKNILSGSGVPYFLKPEICTIADSNEQLLTGLVLNLKKYKDHPHLHPSIENRDVASHGRIRYVQLNVLIKDDIDDYIRNIKVMDRDVIYTILKNILPDYKSKLKPPSATSKRSTSAVAAPPLPTSSAMSAAPPPPPPSVAMAPPARSTTPRSTRSAAAAPTRSTTPRSTRSAAAAPPTPAPTPRVTRSSARGMPKGGYKSRRKLRRKLRRKSRRVSKK